MGNRELHLGLITHPTRPAHPASPPSCLASILVSPAALYSPLPALPQHRLPHLRPCCLAPAHPGIHNSLAPRLACRYEPSALEVVREVPLPTLQEMGGSEGYLPSQRFPSDHLPVVFDLRFRSAAAAGTTGGGSSGGRSAAAGPAAAGGNGSAGAAAGSEGEGGGNDAAAAAKAAGNVLPAAMYNVGLAAEALGRTEVLAVPTDTLYGLAACANSSTAVAHIYATKQRGDHKPLAICVADVEEVARYGDTSVRGEARGAGRGGCTLPGHNRVGG